MAEFAILFTDRFRPFNQHCRHGAPTGRYGPPITRRDLCMSDHQGARQALLSCSHLTWLQRVWTGGYYSAIGLSGELNRGS
jgi:hypothetical protein